MPYTPFTHFILLAALRRGAERNTDRGLYVLNPYLILVMHYEMGSRITPILQMSK
jgi:hypothetical protein